MDPKAKIAEPRVDARAVRQGSGKWIFRNLPPGRYDLVILGADHLRVEGFRYPPITEFDPFLPPDAGGPEEETREWIVKHIAGSKHYENKVVPLFLAGDEKQVRILVQLVRDKATSFDADFGAPVATVRHEVWQYTNQYGGWVKDRRTEVLDRILMARSEFHRWTWVWEPRLGGIEVARSPQPSRVSCPRNTILAMPEAGFRTEPAALGPLARPGAGAPLSSGLPPVQVARLVGFWHRRPGRHGVPHHRRRLLGARAA